MTDDQPDDAAPYKITNPEFAKQVVHGIALQAVRKQVESGEGKYPTLAAYYEQVWAPHGTSPAWLDHCLYLADIVAPSGSIATPMESAAKPQVSVLQDPFGPFPRIEKCLVIETAHSERMAYSPGASFAVPTFGKPFGLTFTLFGERSTASRPVTASIVSASGDQLVSVWEVCPLQVVAADQTVFLLGVAIVYPGAGTYRLKIVVDGRDHFVAPFELTEG